MFKRICTRLWPLLVRPAECQLLSAIIIIISRGSNLSVDILTTDLAENTDATMQNCRGVAWRGVAWRQDRESILLSKTQIIPLLLNISRGKINASVCAAEAPGKP